MHQRAVRGLVAAAATPFTEELLPDAGQLARHCRRLLEQGCDAVLVLGSTGEANSLSVEERLALLEHLDQAGLGPSLLVGVGCCALPDTVRLTRKALAMAAAGVLALPPFYYRKVTSEGVARYFSHMIDEVGDDRLRLYLYHIPQYSGVPVGLDLLQRLSVAYPSTLVGVKDSGGDWSYTARLMRELPRLSVFTGTEEHLLASLRLGGSGCISATFNVIAPEAAPVYRGFELSDMKHIHHLQDRLTLLRRTFAGCSMIPAIKIVLERLHPDEGWNRLRPPLITLGDQEGAALLEGLRGAGVRGV